MARALGFATPTDLESTHTCCPGGLGPGGVNRAHGGSDDSGSERLKVAVVPGTLPVVCPRHTGRGPRLGGLLLLLSPSAHTHASLCVLQGATRPRAYMRGCRGCHMSCTRVRVWLWVYVCPCARM